jgi:hypothetical protein
MMPMFSRDDRDRLAEIINRYLNEELTAFKFDDQLSELAAGSRDETVKQVAHLFWYHYDDVEDHKVVASKEEWDYFQRLLLIVESDAHIISQSFDRKWTARQAVASVCLALFGLAVAKTGFGSHLIVVTVPLGIISMLLFHWRSSVEAKRLHSQTALVPFGSLPEMLSLRRNVRNFVKTRYPASLGSRRIRSPLTTSVMLLDSWIGWLTFSPLALLFQVLPETEQRWRVVRQ